MISQLLGAPHLTFLDLLIFFRDQLGTPLMHVDESRYEKGYMIYKPEVVRGHFPVKFVYSSNLSSLEKLYDSLNDDGYTHCVLVGGSSVELQEHNLLIYPKGTFGMEEVRQCNAASLYNAHQEILKVVDLKQEVLKSLSTTSILQKIHPLFYRIGDKEQRSKAQTLVFRYLCGLTNKPPITNHKKLDEMVRDPAAVELRKAVILAFNQDSVSLATSLHPTADEFDIRYLMSRREKELTAITDARKSSRASRA